MMHELRAAFFAHSQVAGNLPHPRSHHTASLVEFDEEADGEAEKKIFIIGGYGGNGSARDFSIDVHCPRPPCTQHTGISELPPALLALLAYTVPSP